MKVVTAEANSRGISLEGRGQSEKTNLVGTAEADVLRKKVESFGDPKLYAVSIVADALSRSQQPVVPATMLGGGEGQGNMLSVLMSLLVADKLGVRAVPQVETK
ncbi:MAG TPA: hypothetical protein VHR72_15770 [Gemmataceae bacterium]|jgi:hypothetical protein|nr:hypothetical protein [Gemmataceae bacterium]